MNPPKPFLKWPGGKRKVIPQLLPHLPQQFNTYYEPFVGAGALLFHLQPEKAVINDINAELINCYKIIRDNPENLITTLSKHAKNHNKTYFYQIRELDRFTSYNSLSPVEKAARTIYLNKTCYNGLFRVNSKGQFNAPIGNYKNPKILDEANIKAVSYYLNNNDVEINNKDYQETLEKATRNDLIYLDPPYHPVSNTANFTAYNSLKFNKQEQLRVKRTFDELNDRECYIILSNSRTELILDLYEEYEVNLIKAARNINCKPGKREKVNELIVTNNYKILCNSIAGLPDAIAQRKEQ